MTVHDVLVIVAVAIAIVAIDMLAYWFLIVHLTTTGHS